MANQHLAGVVGMAQRTLACKRGHPFTADNIYVSPGGQRHCRACRKLRDANRAPSEHRRLAAIVRSKQYYQANRERHNAWVREWYQRNPDASRLYSLRNRLKRHGMTEADYLAMFEAQGGACVICRQPETRTNRRGERYLLAIDHDHETGQVRGLLCQECNKGLGAFDDDPDRLTAAAAYLIGARDGATRKGEGSP